MPLGRVLSRDRPEWGPEEPERVRRELLTRLDPWSYWIAALPAAGPGDFAVVGTTGAFVVAVWGLAGQFHVDKDRASVGGKPIGGLREVRSEARRLKAKLADAAVFSDVSPIVCLSHATAGAPLTVRGVRIVGLADLISEITRHERVLLPNRAQRGAEALGTVLRSARGGQPTSEGDEE
jgi:hypothetical protein